MGKRLKKGRNNQKEKRVVTPSPNVVSQQHNVSVETVRGEVAVPKHRASCSHLEKGVNLSVLTEKLGSVEAIKCEDCRERTSDRKANRGKDKHGKKKKGGGSADSSSEKTAIWMCLECGYFTCGGVGFPTIKQCHSIRHARSFRHPLAIQFENPNLRWCFTCNTLIPVEKTECDREQKDMMSEIVKVIKGRTRQGASSVDVEDVWFGSGSTVNKTNSENTTSGGLYGKGGYVVRGLANLGNTCFFNSVMQNLLSLNSLRDYFLKLEGSVGPLTIALKKLFIETTAEKGLRIAINPRSLFGCLCAKAPQFKGFQQHDSHELLRCLLDALGAEDFNVKRQIYSSQMDGRSQIELSTFVDDLFGGKTSSTVRCVECGHSSTVFEPFLDLSLPVPTKRPLKKGLTSRAKKMKLPPKRGGRFHAKLNKDTDLVSDEAISKPSASRKPSLQEQPGASGSESIIASMGESASLGVIQVAKIGDDKDQISLNISGAYETETGKAPQCALEKSVASLNDSTWLEYLEPSWLDHHKPDTASDNCNMASADSLLLKGTENEETANTNTLPESNLGATSQICVQNNLKEESSENFGKDLVPGHVKDSDPLWFPQTEEKPGVAEIMRGAGEASSSAVNIEQEPLDFEGFGGLFDEPDPTSDPNSVQADGLVENGLIAGNSSESEPDEVDNTESPVSVESCLAFFTKPELLSNEHGWHCENCLKTVREQKLKSKKIKPNIKSRDPVNGGLCGVYDESLHCRRDFPSSTEVRSLNNGNFQSDVAHNASVRCSASQEQRVVDSSQIRREAAAGQICEQNRGTAGLPLPGDNNDEAAHSETSHSSSCYRTCAQASFGDQASDACAFSGPIRSTECNDGEVNSRDLEQSAGICKLGESKDKEMNSESVKVRRDATKRILIDKAPPILTIHLKRFSQDARGRFSKLNGHVDFRDTIDLRPYMDPRCNESDEGYSYHLVAVIEHLGSMKGGHYVAYVRSSKRKDDADKGNWGSVWYHISDSHVHEVSLEAVLRREAYILFYEKA